MEAQLVEYFKDKHLSISTVLSASVVLAEKVNSDTTLTGLQKTELVVSALRDYLKDTPELVALVEGVVPETLRLVVSSARGGMNLKAPVKRCMLFAASAPCVPSEAKVALTSAAEVSQTNTSKTSKTSPGSWRNWFSFTKAAAKTDSAPEVSAVKVVSPAEELKPTLEVREANWKSKA
uniref:Uncharacterized protein n=1 Tax=viral metagenome TaxID=1070528 RepID=A0A6C0L5Q5_9ZZZZ